jgi:hypothetical protein
MKVSKYDINKQTNITKSNSNLGQKMIENLSKAVLMEYKSNNKSINNRIKLYKFVPYLQFKTSGVVRAVPYAYQGMPEMENAQILVSVTDTSFIEFFKQFVCLTKIKLEEDISTNSNNKSVLKSSTKSNNKSSMHLPIKKNKFASDLFKDTNVKLNLTESDTDTDTDTDSDTDSDTNTRKKSMFGVYLDSLDELVLNVIIKSKDKDKYKVNKYIKLDLFPNIYIIRNQPNKSMYGFNFRLKS